MNIGILFGSFDPIHIGHIALATSALNSKLIDEVIIVPAYHNPWKKEQPASFRDRYLMCCTAIHQINGIDVNNAEEYLIEKGVEKVNTYNTLGVLKKKYANDNLRIIMANETFNELKDWYKGNEILHENEFIIFPRGDISTDWRMVAGAKNTWIIRTSPRMDISSTMIRHHIKEGLEIIPWVPKEVAKYIKQENLYK